MPYRARRYARIRGRDYAPGDRIQGELRNARALIGARYIEEVAAPATPAPPETEVLPAPEAPNLAAMRRDDLNDLATRAGIVDADALPNKEVVIEAILGTLDADTLAALLSGELDRVAAGDDEPGNDPEGDDTGAGEAGTGSEPEGSENPGTTP